MRKSTAVLTITLLLLMLVIYPCKVPTTRYFRSFGFCLLNMPPTCYCGVRLP